MKPSNISLAAVAISATTLLPGCAVSEVSLSGGTMAALVIGLLSIGATAGVVVMALCASAHQRDEALDRVTPNRNEDLAENKENICE